ARCFGGSAWASHQAGLGEKRVGRLKLACARIAIFVVLPVFLGIAYLVMTGFIAPRAEYLTLHFCRFSMSAPMPETWVLIRQLNKEWLLHERRRCCTQLRDVGVDRKTFPFRNQALTWRLGQLALDSSL
ncbi:unnamed protein product, partial [Symbiodinium pilosum]